MHCHYGVMKIYNGDFGLTGSSIFSAANSFAYSACEYVQRASSFIPGVKRTVFSVNLCLVEYIPDYYDPNNTQAASRATINLLELYVMSDLYYATATLRENNIVTQ